MIAVLLTGCIARSPAPAAQPVQAAPMLQTLSAPAVKAAIPEQDPTLEKYIDVLEGIYYDRVLPDGQRLDPFDDPDEAFPNEFAIFDIDRDGEAELSP